MIYAGVELGGTKAIAMLARGPGEIVAREVVATTSPDETLAKIEDILREWKRGPGFDAVGIASFGPIDLDPSSDRWGRILATPKPGWRDADVVRRLQKAAGTPVGLDTDVNGAALAEIRWGSGQGLGDFAYITVGTGVGVGLIVDGKPTRGFGHCELGHIRVVRLPGDEWAGSCPFHGACVEGLASGSALRSRLGKDASAISADDPVWDSVVHALAQLCQAITCAAAPRRIAIGGGVIEAHPELIGRIETAVVESLNGFIQLPENFLCRPVLGSDAGPFGAIALAMTAEL